MLTAFSDKDLVERARDAGVMAYVVKPFTIEDLRPALDIARSRWQERQALESAGFVATPRGLRLRA